MSKSTIAIAAVAAVLSAGAFSLGGASEAGAKKIEFKSDIERRIQRQRAQANRLGRTRPRSTVRSQRQNNLRRFGTTFNPNEIWRRAAKSGSND
ncbi:MAG: hypothetical protein AAFO62_01125 [Pseudomonadota bacterium]